MEKVTDLLWPFYLVRFQLHAQTLALLPEPLDKLQALVEGKFQDIRNTGRSCFNFMDQPLLLEHLQVHYRLLCLQLLRVSSCELSCYLMNHNNSS